MKNLKTTKNMYFSGGIFITTLFSACKEKDNNKNVITEEKAFIGLMDIIDMEFDKNCGSNIKSAVSNYKKCKDNGALYFPFNNDTKLLDFFEKYEEKNEYLFNRAIKFIDEFIDSNDSVRKDLFAKIRYLVENDSFDDNLEELNKILKNKKTTIYDLILSSLYYINKYRKNNILGIKYLEKNTKVKNGIRKISIEVPKKYITDIENTQIKQLKPKDEKIEISEKRHRIALSEHDKLEELVKEYKQYLDDIKSKYQNIKTILYYQPKRFYDFYECNDLKYINSGKEYIIKNANIKSLSEISNQIIISGAGGMGKSMMIRNLLLDTILNIDNYHKIPFFIQVKNYASDDINFYTYIKNLLPKNNDTNNDALNELFENGDAVFFIDGLDELNLEIKEKFEKDIFTFIDKYIKCQYVLTSRPCNKYISYENFEIINIMPFDVEKAISLIKKLDFRLDNPKIKEKFIIELKNNYSKTHKEFIENPLLLTMLLHSYDTYAGVPEKTYLFYNEAYSVITKEHDGTKGLNRKFATKVDSDRFKSYLGEFSYLTYIDSKNAFTPVELEEIYNKMHSIKNDNKGISFNNFIEDLTITTNIMYFEDGYYQFIHRSFQEFFCVYFITKQQDDNLYAIAQKINKKQFVFNNDKVFKMLHEAIPTKFKKFIVLPYLENIIKDGENDIDKYISFLKREHYTIYCDIGDTDGWCDNTPYDRLYEFIIKEYNLEGIVEEDSLPFDDSFVSETYVYEDIENESKIINYNDIPACRKDYYDYIEPAGYTMEIAIDNLLKRKESHLNLYNAIINDKFGLKIEYNNILKFIESIKNSTINSDDDLLEKLDY